jgi:hypothetical protein
LTTATSPQRRQEIVWRFGGAVASLFQPRNQLASWLARSSGRTAHRNFRRLASKAQSREQYFFCTE